eukprot:g5714.t1
MTEKALKIKTGVCKRLSKDLRMYKKEEEDFLEKLKLMQSDGSTAHAIKKQKEFVDETSATVKDIFKRLQAAVSELQAVLKDYDKEDETAAQASEILASMKDLGLGEKAVASAAGPQSSSAESKRPLVAVYGSGTAVPGDALWKLAQATGRLLATKGFDVINGGYGGTMEAVALGVRDAGVKGAAVEGVISPAAFPSRGQHGNSYLTRETKAAAFSERVSILVSSTTKFIIFPGAIGTLLELVFAWTSSILESAAPHVVVAFRDPWEKVCRDLMQTLKMPNDLLSSMHFVDTAEEAVAKLLQEPVRK